MNKCGRTECDAHECELCASVDVDFSQEPCSICSVTGSGTTCQFEPCRFV